MFLNSAFQKGQKTFITISNLNNLNEEIRELADLFIQTKGFIPVNPNKNKLSIEVNNGILKKNSKITLNKQVSEFYNKN
jgi:hypothetical protein